MSNATTKENARARLVDLKNELSQFISDDIDARKELQVIRRNELGITDGAIDMMHVQQSLASNARDIRSTTQLAIDLIESLLADSEGESK